MAAPGRPAAGPAGRVPKCVFIFVAFQSEGWLKKLNWTKLQRSNVHKHSLIGSGAVICKDVEPYSVMVGNPGRKIGTIDEKGERNIKEY